jgi:hypothetical protein
VNTASVPLGHEQRAGDGAQFFRLHPALAEVLDSELRDHPAR